MQNCSAPSLAAQAWNIVGFALAVLVGLAILAFILAAIVGTVKGLRGSIKQGGNDRHNDGI